MVYVVLLGKCEKAYDKKCDRWDTKILLDGALLA